MTLLELYEGIDWSMVDTTLAEWEEEKKPEHDPPKDWKERWRTTLLLYALPQGMVEVEHWSEDRMQDARGILGKMGVWDQVAPLLEANAVIGRNVHGSAN